MNKSRSSKFDPWTHPFVQAFLERYGKRGRFEEPVPSKTPGLWVARMTMTSCPCCEEGSFTLIVRSDGRVVGADCSICSSGELKAWAQSIRNLSQNQNQPKVSDRQNAYVPCPLPLLANPAISPQQLDTYLWLRSHEAKSGRNQGLAWPSVKRLADLTDKKERQIKRDLFVLRTLGAIRPDGRKGRCVAYRFPKQTVSSQDHKGCHATTLIGVTPRHPR